MPIYEYECTSCGKVHEIIQKMSDKPIVKCPKCSGRLQKLISQSSFHLKGSGWYATDYAGKSNSGSSPTKKHKDKPTDSSSQSEKKNSE
jgi:putative FmdB family regulatory protein